MVLFWGVCRFLFIPAFFLCILFGGKEKFRIFANGKGVVLISVLQTISQEFFILTRCFDDGYVFFTKGGFFVFVVKSRLYQYG